VWLFDSLLWRSQRCSLLFQCVLETMWSKVSFLFSPQFCVFCVRVNQLVIEDLSAQGRPDPSGGRDWRLKRSRQARSKWRAWLKT
jgi:hypothetical protein